ncbi:MAG TPA: hypothetical protein VMF59_07065 [Bacteroidota bacterium]|nr:hypothetical protein [Bacteroidota bacterium]
MILYSKGATEALEGRGRLFGERRFRDLIRANERLSADQFAEAITQEITTWTGMNAGGRAQRRFHADRRRHAHEGDAGFS